MNYLYWNDFVDSWKNLPPAVYSGLNPVPPYIHFLGWENPNIYQLMNSSSPNDYSLHHLPEPWWGNDGTHPLNSVVVNYNPGAAGPNKHFGAAFVLNLYGFNDYSSFVNSEATGNTNHFRLTNRWHLSKRAKRVFNTLTRTGISLNGQNNLCNHLSVEMIPWHTTNTGNTGNYIDNNLYQIFTSCLQFAAEQSRRIVNYRLKNKVIMRLSGQKTILLLNDMVRLGFGHYTIVINQNYTQAGPPVTHGGSSVTGNGGYSKFVFKAIPEIEFISIWGKGRTGNDFPPNGDMDWIFANII